MYNVSKTQKPVSRLITRRIQKAMQPIKFRDNRISYVYQQVPRKKFTAEDDKRLIELVSEHRFNWNDIATYMSSWTARQLRERYMSLTTTSPVWSAEEDELLKSKVEELGGNWPRISLFFNKRNTSSLKNRYTHLKRHSLKKNLGSPPGICNPEAHHIIPANVVKDYFVVENENYWTYNDRGNGIFLPGYPSASEVKGIGAPAHRASNKSFNHNQYDAYVRAKISQSEKIKRGIERGIDDEYVSELITNIRNIISRMPNDACLDDIGSYDQNYYAEVERRTNEKRVSKPTPFTDFLTGEEMEEKYLSMEKESEKFIS